MAERTPLFDAAARVGAVFADEAGWLVPAHFGAALEEYHRCREGACVFDQSHRGKIELRGTDARIFLHRLCSNDVAGLPADGGCEAFLCNAKAKIISHCLVFLQSADMLWLDVAPGVAEKTLQHLNHYLISDQVELYDRTREFAQLHVAGSAVQRALGAVFPGGLGDLGLLQHRLCRWNDVQVHVRRVDALGLEGYDFVCTANEGSRLWQALLAAGVAPAGAEAYHVLRIEAGTPLYGVDLDENTLAMEVDRTKQAISYLKGCFPGQEPIVRARDLGHVNWSIRGLRMEGAAVPAAGTKLLRDGADVGRVTSAAFSPRFQAAVALGYVRRGSDAPGTLLSLAADGATQTAVVVSLPFASLAG